MRVPARDEEAEVLMAIDDVVAANAATARGTDAEAPPARHLVIVTCMDARVMPADAFGLACGDAHVLRNAGGRVTDDVLRSLAASWHFLGTREVMVVQHTRCGMQTEDPAATHRQLEAAVGGPVDVDLLNFVDQEGAVRADVARVRDSELAPDGLVVRGFVYDVRTGRLREVG